MATGRRLLGWCRALGATDKVNEWHQGTIGLPSQPRGRVLLDRDGDVVERDGRVRETAGADRKVEADPAGRVVEPVRELLRDLVGDRLGAGAAVGAEVRGSDGLAAGADGVHAGRQHPDPGRRISGRSGAAQVEHGPPDPVFDVAFPGHVEREPLPPSALLGAGRPVRAWVHRPQVVEHRAEHAGCEADVGDEREPFVPAGEDGQRPVGVARELRYGLAGVRGRRRVPVEAEQRVHAVASRTVGPFEHFAAGVRSFPVRWFVCEAEGGEAAAGRVGEQDLAFDAVLGGCWDMPAGRVGHERVLVVVAVADFAGVEVFLPDRVTGGARRQAGALCLVRPAVNVGPVDLVAEPPLFAGPVGWAAGAHVCHVT